jgi:transposase
VTDWPSYNRSLVKRGEILFSYDFLETWHSDLEKMNENKKGKPYRYPDSFLLVVGYIRICFHLPYRQTEGIIKATGKCLPNHPSYGHICKRVNKLNIDINDSKMNEYNDEDYLIIAVDSTGIKITNRGQWISDKWGAQNNKKKRKGYLKIHIAVDVKSKEIISMQVTNEHVHDSKVLPELVENIIKSNKIIGKLFADGAYDGNDIFRCLADNGIHPCIKVRKNARVRLKKGHFLRNLSVLVQRNDFKKWKDSVSYGKRWMAETVFSSIKIVW